MPCIKQSNGGYKIRRSAGGLYPKIYASKKLCEIRVSQMEIHRPKKFKKTQGKLSKGGIGAKQAAKVMKLFYAGKLRAKSGEIVKDVNQAQAIAMSEGRTAEKRGVSKRTWKGQTRMRPRLNTTKKKASKAMESLKAKNRIKRGGWRIFAKSKKKIKIG